MPLTTRSGEDGSYGVGGFADFAEFVEARWARLVRSAVLLGCAPHDAEDIVQGALVRCLNNWAKVQQADHRDAYVHRILVNTIASARRRRWNREVAVESLPETGVSAGTDAVDDYTALMAALARLGEAQRTVVVLRYYAQLSEKEMSHVLEVPAGTIKSRLSRALDSLSEDPSLANIRGTH